MRRFCFPLLLACLIGLALPAASQTKSPAKQAAATNDPAAKGKAEAKSEAERIEKERRDQARALLLSLASDARSFRDEALRSRTLSRIADVLWAVDAEQGRELFRKAWEAAETGDQNQGTYTVGEGPLNLRQEVLRLAGQHDRLLAEELLEKLKADAEETKAESAQPSLWGLPGAAQQRLDLAQGLLTSGDIDRALQFADPLLSSVNLQTIDFLSRLRDTDPAAADQRYAAMLATTSGNIVADANTISLLSSYVFTPHLYVVFNTEGAASWSRPRTLSPAATVASQLQLAFFQTASGVLLRPQASPESDQSSAGIPGKYMVVKRLLPIFDQYAPREMATAMRGQLETLNSLVNDGVRQGETEWVQKGITPEKPIADQEQSLLDRIEHARTSDERDALYFQLALLALSNDDLKARDYAGKIDESWFCKQAQAWVDATLAIAAIRKKDYETLLELARNGELTHIQRVWALTQAAKLLAQSDRTRALAVLDEATAEVRRLEGADLDRPGAWLGIANARWVAEPARAWDAIFDAVKAANSSEGFTGESGRLTLRVGQPRQQLRLNFVFVPDFGIMGILTELAHEDYERAVQLARGFQGEAPRANATIAIARAVLDTKRTPAKSAQRVAKPITPER